MQDLTPCYLNARPDPVLPVLAQGLMGSQAAMAAGTFNVHHKVKSTGFQPVSFSRADSWPRLCTSHRRGRKGLPGAGSEAGGLPVPCDPREPTYFSRWLFSSSLAPLINFSYCPLEVKGEFV